MDRLAKVIFGIAIGVVLVSFLYSWTPVGRWLGNVQAYRIAEIDDRTSYKTRKEVEDTARAMISSYNSDKLVYERYKDAAEGSDKQSWGEAALIRANSTASTYNNYILKNSFVWEKNIPKDILQELEYLS
jgi:hypothetical protein